MPEFPEDHPGTLAYRNWVGADLGVASSAAMEYPCYTDADLRGDLSEGLGPFKLMNTIAGETNLEPSAVMRIEFHLGDEIDDWFGPGDDHYHGGTMSDEVLALISLNLGIRIKSGDETRRFDLDDDPRGRPIAYGVGRSTPVLRVAGPHPVIPSLLGPHTLNDATLAARYRELSPKTSLILARTARLYQDAVWMADSEPQLSWLLLVSAVETAANHWRAEEEAPRDRLRASQPDLETLLLEAGGNNLLNLVASLVAPYMGSTSKFIKFLIEFIPDEPEKRPPEFYRIRWSRQQLRESFSLIYDRRSRALHGGKPFPYPMCSSPLKVKDVYAEAPQITGAMGAQWSRDETPMHLHVFERIARLALIKWWNTLLPPLEDA